MTTEIDTTAVVKTAELAELMQTHPELFNNRIFTKSTLSTYAARFLMPARQLRVERKVTKQTAADIIVRAIPGNFTFNLADVVEWCRLGADRSACIEILKKRESQI